jgi:hypothetical protein
VWGLTAKYAIPLIQLGEKNRVEVKRPDPALGFLEADVMKGPCIRDVEEALLKAHRPRPRDPLHEEVTRILLRGGSRRIRAARRVIAGRGSSVRMAAGSPYVRKVRSKIGRASTAWLEGTP